MNDDTDNKSSPPEDETPESLTPANTDNGPTFGQWMIEQRQAKGISLEEIASVTKIQLGMLRNIEANDYSKLPAPAFIRGFIVNFARFIGVSEVEAVERFRTQLKKSDSINSLSAYLGQNTSQTATSVASASTSDVPRKELTQSGFEKNYNRPSAAMDMDATPIFTPKRLLIAVGVIVVIIITAVLFSIGSKQDKAEETPAATSETATTEGNVVDAIPEEPGQVVAPTGAAVPPAIPVPAATTPKKVEPEVKAAEPAKDEGANFTYHLKLRGLDSSWVNVRVDQKGSTGTMLEKGQSKDFYGNQKIVIALSDAGGVEISWNGQTYQPAGYRGDVKSLSLPDDLSKLKTR